jgi:hypothetical protein
MRPFLPFSTPNLPHLSAQPAPFPFLSTQPSPISSFFINLQLLYSSFNACILLSAQPLPVINFPMNFICSLFSAQPLPVLSFLVNLYLL